VRIAICAVALGTIVLFVAPVACYYVPMFSEPAPRAFEPELWKAQGESTVLSGIPTRASMVDDLLDRGLLIGLSRDEVVEALGDPWAFHGADRETAPWWVYFVELPIIDETVLEVSFGAPGRVAKVRVFNS